MLNFVKSFLIVNKKGFGKVQREKLIHSKWLHRQQCWWRRFSSFLWGFRQRTFLQVYRQHKVTGHYIYIGPCPTVVTYNGCDLMRSYATQPQNGRGVNRSGPIPNRGIPFRSFSTLNRGISVFSSDRLQLLRSGMALVSKHFIQLQTVERLWSHQILFTALHIEWRNPVSFNPWMHLIPIRSGYPRNWEES